MNLIDDEFKKGIFKNFKKPYRNQEESILQNVQGYIISGPSKDKVALKEFG